MDRNLLDSGEGPLPQGPEGLRKAVRWARRPIVDFFTTEASGGILLMLATVVALVWANSPYAGSYHDLWHTYVTVGAEDLRLKLSLAHWINDGLMAIFFFLVGLEIKRELVAGELSTPRQAVLPAMAALGGMLVPAALYVLLNRTGEGTPGWGIPMATDIAFALGILILLGKRVPLGLKIFLTALAIVDDLGAVLVIAIFYTGEISMGHLGVGIGLVAALGILSRLGMRATWIYLTAGVVVWYCFLQSGVHATVAGVLVAVTVPHRVVYDRERFIGRVRAIADFLDREASGESREDQHEREMAMQGLSHATERWSSPLVRLEHALGPVVSYFIMPVFALANAGVHIDFGNYFELVGEAVPLGIVLGLVVGKQVGIVAFSWIAVRTGMAQLPRNVNWRGLHGAATLGGVGFTMSLFIANLAFARAELLDMAKVGILTASLLAGLLGTALLLTNRPRAGAETVD